MGLFRSFAVVILVACLVPAAALGQSLDITPPGLTVVAIGDAGENGSALRATAFYVTDMYTGRHDAGKPDAILFLGDNFLPLGLNVPADDVDGTARSVLRHFDEVFTTLPRAFVHAIPGEHDYYSRFGEQHSLFFGLFTSGEQPTGISDRGILREERLEQWTFHSRLASETTMPEFPGSVDSVQFVFFDSALPLRTDPSRWHEALASLHRILQASGARKAIAWRILCVHHPWYSVGVHGGYSIWNDEDSSVDYLTNCDKDSNAVGFVRNWIDPEDLCADRYRQYADSLRAVVSLSGVKIQILLGAHDRSLQLLYYPDRDTDCDVCPKVHIISGAGSLTTRVRLPSPPHVFTSGGKNPQEAGVSPPGFVQLRFDRGHVRVVFFNARNGEPIDMGSGHTVFWIDRAGNLVDR